MEMLLYQSTQFRDVKKILDRAHGFAGLLTAGGIEASRLDMPFVCDQKVLSRYDDACGDVRRILARQLGLELPKGFSIPLEAEDLGGLFLAAVLAAAMADYLAQKRRQTQADIAVWLRERRGIPIRSRQHRLRRRILSLTQRPAASVRTAASTPARCSSCPRRSMGCACARSLPMPWCRTHI